jgi:hypothetical protein
MLCSLRLYAGAEVRERDDTGKVWSWPEGSSADFDSDSEESEAAQRRGRQRHKRQQVETQPFPVEALSAARMGAALQAAEEAGVPLPLVLRAAAAGSSQAGGLPRSASSSSGSIDSSSAGRSSGSGKISSSGGGSSSSVLHVFPFGIDGSGIRSILESLGLTGSLVVADRIQDADTVLALRSKIKTSE